MPANKATSTPAILSFIGKFDLVANFLLIVNMPQSYQNRIKTANMMNKTHFSTPPLLNVILLKVQSLKYKLYSGIKKA